MRRRYAAAGKGVGGRPSRLPGSGTPSACPPLTPCLSPGPNGQAARIPAVNSRRCRMTVLGIEVVGGSSEASLRPCQPGAAQPWLRRDLGRIRQPRSRLSQVGFSSACGCAWHVSLSALEARSCHTTAPGLQPGPPAVWTLWCAAQQRRLCALCCDVTLLFPVPGRAAAHR